MAEIEDGYLHILQDPQRVYQFVQQKIDSKIQWYQLHHHFCEGKSWVSWQDKVLDFFYKEILTSLATSRCLLLYIGHIENL